QNDVAEPDKNETLQKEVARLQSELNQLKSSLSAPSDAKKLAERIADLEQLVLYSTQREQLRQRHFEGVLSTIAFYRKLGEAKDNLIASLRATVRACLLSGADQGRRSSADDAKGSENADVSPRPLYAAVQLFSRPPFFVW